MAMKIEFDDNYFMSKAIDEAKIALSKGEVPVGAVIVADNKIIARAHNMVEALNLVSPVRTYIFNTFTGDKNGQKK